ncbi:MAG: hypothetical protein HYZ42_10685 [Bacteroidetes bacterium]|nr:hypothetical protein [Bacteroidota bacterium]
MKTSGICSFPLTNDLLSMALQYPLAITQAVTTPADVFTLQNTTTYGPVMMESAQYARADKFVFRLDPSDPCAVTFYATNLGKPLPKAIINVQEVCSNSKQLIRETQEDI